MPTLAELRGLWRRSLIQQPCGIDTTTEVYWLQSPSLFIDLRQPHPPRSFARIDSLDDLSLDDCAWLARQEGFAGRLTTDAGFYEWQRRIDYQPASGAADAGSLEWDGSTLVERGRYADYLEHWQRNATESTEPAVGFALRNAIDGVDGAFVVVGRFFMWARGRRVGITGGSTLGEQVAAAQSLQAARTLLDCEISFGTAHHDPRNPVYRISHSTLPFRVGGRFGVEVHDAVLTLREVRRDGASSISRWDIIEKDIGP